MRDAVLVVAVAAAFAWVATAHVAIVVSLLLRKRFWRALSALLLPLLAPWWAYTEGLRKTAALWIAGAVAYGIALAFALASR